MIKRLNRLSVCVALAGALAGGCSAGAEPGVEEEPIFFEAAPETVEGELSSDGIELAARIEVSATERVDFLVLGDDGEADIGIAITRDADGTSEVGEWIAQRRTPLEIFRALAPSEVAPEALLRDHEERASRGLASADPVVLERREAPELVALAGPTVGWQGCHTWRIDFEDYADDNGMAYQPNTYLNSAGTGYMGTMDRIRMGVCNHDISDGPVRVRVQRRIGAGGAWSSLAGYTVQLQPHQVYDYYGFTLCNSTRYHRIYVDQVEPNPPSWEPGTGDWYDLLGAWREACFFTAGG